MILKRWYVIGKNLTKSGKGTFEWASSVLENKIEKDQDNKTEIFLKAIWK